MSPESTSELAQQAAALPDVRQIDPGVVSASFQQLQQVKGYYKFANVLSVDRYPVPGSSVPEDMIVGVRDMSGPPAGQNNWINAHLVYTHGFGFVAAAANSASDGGNPEFTESDIPPSGELNVQQPRVYFGEQETSYAIVGGHQLELDYPNSSASGQQNTTYHGSGGVPVGSPLNRLLYAIKFRELNILLSGAIDGNSKIMYIRDPLSRVAKVAPFLTLDGDTYPVVVGGQIYWVVDAYTTTDNYPYSQRLSLQQASSNSYSPGGSAVGPGDQVNYIRNSVKAVVNAYTGAVTLYQWGGNDPVLDAWKKAFPGVIKPESAIPSRPPAAPALPADPVRGAAADPGAVPRDPGPGVLRRAELLVGAHGPERHRAQRVQPAAVLPHDDHARPAAAGVLADHVAHAARPAPTWPRSWRSTATRGAAATARSGSCSCLRTPRSGARSRSRTTSSPTRPSPPR